MVRWSVVRVHLAIHKQPEKDVENIAFATKGDAWKITTRHPWKFEYEYRIRMKSIKVKITAVKSNPDNPRIIRDQKFAELVQSIKDFPEMLEIRPIVVNSKMIILGGNMRFKAAVEAGMKQVPAIVVNLSKQKEREFIIKDNVSGGDWDWDRLANEWDAQELEAWGLETIFDSPEDEEEKTERDSSGFAMTINFNTEGLRDKWRKRLEKEGLNCKIKE